MFRRFYRGYGPTIWLYHTIRCRCRLSFSKSRVQSKLADIGINTKESSLDPLRECPGHQDKKWKSLVGHDMDPINNPGVQLHSNQYSSTFFPYSSLNRARLGGWVGPENRGPSYLRRKLRVEGRKTKSLMIIKRATYRYWSPGRLLSST